VGRKNPLHCTSSGKVLLAYQKPEFIDSYIEKGLKKYTDSTISDPDKLYAELQKIKKQGYAASYGELLEGVHSIAAPIRDYTGQVTAAVTVVGPKQRIVQSKISSIAKHVKEAGNEISKKLGYYK
jgi:DNA-binding IclR family transcriptional regulator